MYNFLLMLEKAKHHREGFEKLLESHPNLHKNPPRWFLILRALERREAITLKTGALATWTPPESTGRSPKDTYFVRDSVSEPKIDWDSPYANPMDPETFDILWQDALEKLSQKPELFFVERSLNADPRYAFKVRIVSDKALSALFSDNVLRPVPDEYPESVFYDEPFHLLVLPYDKLDPKKYEGRLRKLPDGRTSNMAVAMDFERRLGVVYGSAYGGSIKKLLFTVMNYTLPQVDVLPLHCGANDGSDGVALFLGLSGTGKTTLSSDPQRVFIGDDEHLWSERGVANMEGGCYAKLINLRPDKEPEIYNAVFHEDHPLKHGAIVENAMVYPDGSFDLDDDRYTPNSRASYPLYFLSNIKEPPVGDHPRTILFLTADANGVLPPVAKLTPSAAMLWFLMGYTSKLAGTETGIIEPVSTFSRFFGEPFMPLKPDVYAKMLKDKMLAHKTNVYLINTGWTGGPYGVGHRFDINITRQVVRAAISGALEGVEYKEDKLFHLLVPTEAPGVPKEVLWPKNTWPKPEEYDERAQKLARDFAQYFDKVFKGKVPKEVEEACPGK